MKVKAVLIGLMLCAVITSAQRLKGKVTDKGTGTLITGAYVTVELEGKMVGSDTTDVNGEYEIRLPSGSRYLIKAAYPAYDTVRVTDVRMEQDRITYADLRLAPTYVPIEKKKKKTRFMRKEK